MSNQKQYSPLQQAADSRQANFETALRIATIMAEANERLFKLQSEAANAAFEENAKQLRALLNTRDAAAVVQEWAGRYQANMRRILEVTRTCFEIVPQTQAQVARLLEEPFASYSNEAQEYLVQFNQALTDGRDAATAQMKDFIAQTLERVSANQAAMKGMAA